MATRGVKRTAPLKSKAPSKTPRKGPSKRSSKDPNFPKLPSPESMVIYERIAHRKIKATKFLHGESMTSLGVLNGVTALFENIGWGNFLHLHADTYEQPTKEFLATFDKDDDRRVIMFQLQGRAHSLTYDAVNEIMGTPTGVLFKSTTNLPAEFQQGQIFCPQITELESYTPGRDKAAEIIHPCLKIAHRVLTCTIFARGEPGQITKAELFFLWCMTRENGPRPDFASFFFAKCTDTRKNVRGGEICFGGLITILASALSLTYPSPRYLPVRGKTLLDIAALTLTHSISSRTSTTYTWHNPEGVPFYILPDPQFDDFDYRNPAAWLPDRTLNDRGNPVDEPEPEAPGIDEIPEPQLQQEIPGYLPPDFLSRFDTLCLQTQQIHEYLRRGGNFPPPDPPV